MYLEIEQPTRVQSESNEQPQLLQQMNMVPACHNPKELAREWHLEMSFPPHLVNGKEPSRGKKFNKCTNCGATIKTTTSIAVLAPLATY